MTIFDAKLAALLQNMQHRDETGEAADPGKVLQDTLKRAFILRALQNAFRHPSCMAIVMCHSLSNNIGWIYTIAGEVVRESLAGGNCFVPQSRLSIAIGNCMGSLPLANANVTKAIDAASTRRAQS